jgi:hypothetical protein
VLDRIYRSFGATDGRLVGQLAKEFALVHAVLESFAAIDEDHGNFIGELAAQFFVRVNVNFPPSEAGLALQFDQAFFDDLAKVTTFARVNYNFARLRHGGSLAVLVRIFPLSASIPRLAEK